MAIYVKPVALSDGTITRVRQPNRAWAVLPPEGAWVDEDEYWMRRLRDKDCELAEPPVEEPSDSAASQAEDSSAEPRRRR